MTPLQTKRDRALTILVIDSSHSSTEIYQHLLQQDTSIVYQVWTEVYNSHILALHQFHSVDAILLESHFPDLRGFEVLEQLTAQIGEQCPPIIVIDRNEAKLATRALKAGAVDYLVREQITAENLIQAICRAVTIPIEATPLDKRLRENTSSFHLEEQLRHVAKIDAFRVTLADALRTLSDPIEVQTTACCLLGEELSASRVYYYEYNKDAGYGVMHHDYVQNGEASITDTGIYKFENFSSVHTILRQGRPLIIADVANSTLLTAEERKRFEALRFRSLVCIPLVKADRLVAVLNISQSSLRDWMQLEITLIQETAERTWAAVERARAEVALRESEARYRTLFNLMDEGYFLVDVIFDENDQPIDLFYLETNLAAGRMVGQDLTGRKLSEIDQTYEPYWYELFGRVARTGKGERLDRYAELDKKWYSFYVFKVGGKNSNQIAAVFQDITTRKIREANAEFLAEIAEALSGLSSADEIMCTVGAKVGTYLNIFSCAFAEIDEALNQAVIKYSWQTTDTQDMTGVYRLSEFITEEVQQMARARETVIIRNTQTDPRTNKDSYAAFKIHAFVTVPFHHEGKWKYVFTINNSVARNWRKDEIKLIRELTNQCFLRIERARFEERLRQSEEKFRLLVTTSSDTLYRMNADWSEMRHLESENFLTNADKPNPNWIESYIPIEERPQVLAAIEKAIRTKSPFEVEHRVMQVDGTVGWIFSRAVPLLNEQNEIVEWFGAASDVTERNQLLEREQKAREDAEHANRIKDEFLSVLSHELRTPLNPILGWSRLLQTRKFEPAKIAQALATIEQNARFQAKLIDDLLDVAKILRGKLSLNITTVNLALVVDAAIETVKTAATAKSISIHSELPTLGKVSGDPVRLQQIVWNLLSNATKFTPQEGRIDICLAQVENQAQITVRDTGKGISRDFLPHIFESFRQQDASITRQFGGLGLGLAIVHYLVEAHGGTITADSLGEGQGATFTLRLPLLKVEANSHPTDALLEAKLDLTGIRVLAVDDELDARELLMAVLTAYNAKVRVAASADEALAIFASFKPDVLVSDIGMPDMDGYTLIQRIRALTPEAEKRLSLNAIALTAYAREEDRQRALESGYQAHIAKPLEPELLVKAVAELAAQQRN